MTYFVVLYFWYCFVIWGPQGVNEINLWNKTHHTDQWFSTTFVSTFTVTPLRDSHTKKTKCCVENHFHNETIKFIAIGASNIKACFQRCPRWSGVWRTHYWLNIDVTRNLPKASKQLIFTFDTFSFELILYGM